MRRMAGQGTQVASRYGKRVFLADPGWQRGIHADGCAARSQIRAANRNRCLLRHG